MQILESRGGGDLKFLEIPNGTPQKGRYHIHKRGTVTELSLLLLDGEELKQLRG